MSAVSGLQGEIEGLGTSGYLFMSLHILIPIKDFHHKISAELSAG